MVQCENVFFFVLYCFHQNLSFENLFLLVLRLRLRLMVNGLR